MVGGNTWNNDNKKLFHLIKTAFQNNIPVGAICGAVDYLEKNGFLNDYNHTGNSVDAWNDYENYHAKNSFFSSKQ